MPKADFGKKLRDLREAKGWSMNELARQANLSPSIVHDLEKGKRTAGRTAFRKLANAFGMEGAKADSFVIQALDSASKQRTLARQREWPDIFNNWLVMQLAHQGVEREKVTGWELKEAKGRKDAPDLVVDLKGGERFVIEFKMRKSGGN